LCLLHNEGDPQPGPTCKTPVNPFDAAGVDLDAYDFGVTGALGVLLLPPCHRRHLRRTARAALPVPGSPSEKIVVFRLNGSDEGLPLEL
jgi:hypothetical protein